MLSDPQIARYSRQIILPSVGGRGQQQLLSATVAVAGRVEMAHVVALYLAAAGIGRLFLLGAEGACCRDLEMLNPDCQVTAVAWPLVDDAIEQIVSQSVAVVCADADAATVARLNMPCLGLRRPLLYGRVIGAVGEATLLGGEQGGGPCFACFSQQGAPVCVEAADPGVHAVLSGAIGGLIGAIVATEVIKLTLNLGSLLTGQRLTYDALTGRMSATASGAMPGCVVCGSAEIGGRSLSCTHQGARGITV